MSEIEDLKERMANIEFSINVMSGKIDTVKHDFKLASEAVEAFEKQEPKKPWEWWLPKEDETYFAPENTGEIKEYAWEDVALDHQMRSSHSVFKTREDAELFAPLNKWQRAVAWVLRELNDGSDWIDWKNRDQPKYLFYHANEDDEINITTEYEHQFVHDLSHGKSPEIMNKCREILGDEIIEKSCWYFRPTHEPSFMPNYEV